MEKLVPICRHEKQYLHPGSKHIEFAQTFPDEKPTGNLNTDALLRSVFFGRSETIILVKDTFPLVILVLSILSSGTKSGKGRGCGNTDFWE